MRFHAFPAARQWLHAALLGTALGCASSAMAQSEMTRLLVAFPPGGPVDFIARSMSQQLAKELGLQPGAPVQIRTANGTVTGWRTRLGLLQLGDIQLREVAALITPGMEGHEVLLGMSALKQLEFTQKGGTLVLRQSTR